MPTTVSNSHYLALVRALDDLQRLYDDRNAVILRLEAVVANADDRADALHGSLDDARADRDYYRDAYRDAHAKLTTAERKLADITRTLSGEANDLDAWAREYVNANPHASRIPAIKALRAAFPGTSLRDAKDAVDRACAQF